MRGKGSTIFLVLKRTVDIIAALLGMLALALLLPLLAALIKRDGGPLFYRQLRVGEGHKLFVCTKLRTMYPGAEAHEGDLAEGGEAFAQHADDPRVTTVGRALRTLSIDELPQCINILRGEMSLIGPRPLTPDESLKLPAYALKRLCVCPGLTGLAQVSGRGACPPDERLRLDLYYVNNLSFKLELKILFKTVKIVFIKEGAQ